MTILLIELPSKFIQHGALQNAMCHAISSYMAQYFGTDESAWAQAYTTIRADWHKYHADLHLSGEDGVEDMWEGYFRITRALFRLTQTPQPTQEILWQTTHALLACPLQPQQPLAHTSADELLTHWQAQGHQLKALSYLPSSLLNAILSASGLESYFSHSFAPDTLKRFPDEKSFYAQISSQLRAKTMLGITHQTLTQKAMQASGMLVVQTTDTLSSLKHVI
jgi:phosphoglycolate phosphatase-like HAD superfamily hydrolase